MQAERSIQSETTQATSSADESFLAGLAERLGAAARAATIFGEPVERDGITVIPVAKARWGFGGGSGRRSDETGAGGGGAAQVNPVGYIEIRNGVATFCRINTVSLPLVLLSTLGGLFLLKTIASKRSGSKESDDR